MFEGETPVRKIAQLSGVSESTLYRWRVRVLNALLDDCPGPNPARVEQLDTIAEPSSMRSATERHQSPDATRKTAHR